MAAIKVMFRKFKGEVLAIFPYEVENQKGDVCCYAHIGQHSTCDYDYVVKNSKKPSEAEINDLKAELVSIGYELKIVSKRSRKSLNDARIDFMTRRLLRSRKSLNK